jgi:transposase InsO family protein
MDVFTRRVRGWELGRGLDQVLTLAALRRPMRGGRRPEVHHSDQGVQYAATAYTRSSWHLHVVAASDESARSRGGRSMPLG